MWPQNNVLSRLGHVAATHHVNDRTPAAGHFTVGPGRRLRLISFKTALNEAVRSALGSPVPARRYRKPTAPLGVRPEVDLEQALTLAGELEDGKILRKWSIPPIAMWRCCATCWGRSALPET
jgi:hypothetical protein